MPKILLALSVAVASLAIPAAASAANSTQPISPPSADIGLSLDSDLAPDGTGAIAYERNGVVVVSRRVDRTWRPVEDLPSSGVLKAGSVQVEAGNGGRVAVSYISGDHLRVRVATTAGSAFSDEIFVLLTPKAYDFEMNAAGIGYFVGSVGGDVIVRRLSGILLSGQTSPLDKVPAAAAAAFDQAVAVDAQGNAVVAWDEADGANVAINARRLSGEMPGTLVEATVPSLAGAPRLIGAGRVDVESDDAGNAWVAFREQFSYAVSGARGRSLARRLTGNTFGPPVLLDPGPAVPANGTEGESARLAVTPAGDHAIAAGTIQRLGVGAPLLVGTALTPSTGSPFEVDLPTGALPRLTAAIVPGGSGAIAYAYEPRAGVGVAQELRARVRVGAGGFAGPVPLSNPGFGPVASAPAPVAASDADTTVVVAYLQTEGVNKRILAATIDLSRPGGSGADAVVSKLRLSRKTFRKGRRLVKASARRYRTGTTIGFTLSEAAKVRLGFERATRGRKVGRTCRRATRKNRRRKSCTRYLRIRSSIPLNGKAGANKVSFQGRLSRRVSLAPGSYRLTATARGMSGKVSRGSRARFRLLDSAR